MQNSARIREKEQETGKHKEEMNASGQEVEIVGDRFSPGGKFIALGEVKVEYYDAEGGESA